MEPVTAMAPAATNAALAVEDLAIEIRGERHLYPVQGASFEVPRGGLVGLVGESGSGKSLTAAAIIGMLPPGAAITRGNMRLGDVDLARLPERTLRTVRGNRVAMVFQNARASLNPIMTVGSQIAEVVRLREGLGRRESWDRAIETLQAMGIPDPARRAKDYPHQYSGGMAQRAALARAMCCRPELLIADEPTSGLDATLQQQVLEVLVGQVRVNDTALLLITHDIDVVATTCDSVAVMYAGRIMESGPAGKVLGAPVHPYTRRLLESVADVSGARMATIPGVVPAPTRPLAGCPFIERCDLAGEACAGGVPELREAEGRRVACIRK
jgi:oligopeptide/dipeptide ABC transporter ATP-binding protein